MNNLELGRRGEQLALEFLKEQGYRIVGMNFTIRLGRSLEGRPLSLEAVDRFPQGGAAGAGELGVGDRLLDLVGVAVGSLSAAAGLLGLVGDGAVSAEEDSGGLANPGEQG